MTRQQRACLGSVGGVCCAALLPSGEWLKELISNLRPGRWLAMAAGWLLLGGGVAAASLLLAAGCSRCVCSAGGSVAQNSSWRDRDLYSTASILYSQQQISVLLSECAGQLLQSMIYLSGSLSVSFRTLTPTGAPYRDYYTVYTQTLITLSPVGRCGRPFFPSKYASRRA
eukprot:COSAG01_NODE_23851_length_799_cov_1.984286_1_plen_169_part_10